MKMVRDLTVVRSRHSSRVVVLSSFTKSLIRFRGQLLSEMVRAGHKVLALGPEHEPAVVEMLAQIGVEFRAVQMRRAGISPLADLRTLLELTALLWRLRPDVFLAYTTKPVIYGGLAARLAAVPSRYAIITGLGYVYTGPPATLRRRVLQTMTVILYRSALHGVKRLFVYNRDDENDLERLGIIPDSNQILLVNGSGVDLEHFYQVVVPRTGQVFLLVARLLRDKGLLEYVNAARYIKARYPAVRIQLLGPFDPNPTAIESAELNAWIQEGAIEYLGETDDVRPFLAQCTVYVLPSYREGIPRSVLEAMATGRAIITTDAPGCRETVVDGTNGFLVPVQDAMALAKAMERFLHDPTLAVRMGARSRELAVQQFDVNAVNRVLLSSMGLIEAGGLSGICS